MNVPEHLPPWVAEPWYDARRERESPVACFKKQLEVAEAMLERLAIGVVACALDGRHGLSAGLDERIARALADIPGRASFGHWQQVVAAGFSGPPDYLRDVFGFDAVPDLGVSPAIQAAHVALGGAPGSVRPSNFFGVVSSARNEFAHGHADAVRCAQRSAALGPALDELVGLLPTLHTQTLCRVFGVRVVDGHFVARLEVCKGTGRREVADARLPDDAAESARRLDHVVLWDGGSGALPIMVPRWLLHVDASGMLMPWNGRAGNRLRYVVRDERASEDAHVELDDAALAGALDAALRRLGRRDTQELRPPTGELPNAQILYGLVVQTSLVDDGVVSPVERESLDQAARELRLPPSLQAQVEADVRRRLTPSKPVPAAAAAVTSPVQSVPNVPNLPNDALGRRRLGLVAVISALAGVAGGGAFYLARPRHSFAGAHLSASLQYAADRAQPAPVEWVAIPATPDVAAFELSRAEVTVADYYACVGAGICTEPHYDDSTCMVPGPGGPKPGVVPDLLRDSNMPVTCVDFEQATGYVKWAGARLPTDAEWRVAAQAEAAAQEGRPLTCKDVVVSRDAAGECERAHALHVCSLGRRPPYQLCDLYGNVFEWVDAPPEPGGERVARGGSWTREVRYAEPMKQGLFKASEPSVGLGFRLARGR